MEQQNQLHPISEQPQTPQKSGSKMWILFVIVVIALGVGAYLLFVYNSNDTNNTNIPTNTTTNTAENSNREASTNSASVEVVSCNQGCVSQGYSKGECLSGGSGTGSGCDAAGGVQLHSIIDRDTDIPGCNFSAIGSWDECCCL